MSLLLILQQETSQRRALGSRGSLYPDCNHCTGIIAFGFWVGSGYIRFPESWVIRKNARLRSLYGRGLILSRS
jgi:hypothetical protein